MAINKEQIYNELENEFVETVADGKELLSKRAQDVKPILTQWADAKIMLLTGNAADKAAAKEIAEASVRTLEDMAAAGVASAQNLIVERVVSGLRKVFMKHVLPAILGAII